MTRAFIGNEYPAEPFRVFQHANTAIRSFVPASTAKHYPMESYRIEKKMSSLQTWGGEYGILAQI